MTTSVWVIAQSLEQAKDTMTLKNNKIYFNRADALAERQGEEKVFVLSITIPQSGNGTL